MDAVRYADEELLYGARVQILLVETRDEEALVLAAVQPRLGRGRGREVSARVVVGRVGRVAGVH